MRTVSFISIILACLIISLHDIIPHYHQAELQKEQSEHNDLWEFLQDLFLVDLGYEHLESYMSQKSQNLKLIDFESDLTLMQTTLINVEVRFYPDNLRKQEFEEVVCYFSESLICAEFLRGPPHGL